MNKKYRSNKIELKSDLKFLRENENSDAFFKSFLCIKKPILIIF